MSFSLFRFSTSRDLPQIANGKKIESGKRKSVEKKEKERKAIRLFPFRLSPMLSNLIFKQAGRYLENRAKWVLRKKTQKSERGVNDSAIWESGGSLLRTFFALAIWRKHEDGKFSDEEEKEKCEERKI